MSSFVPKLDVLPAPQRALWPGLQFTTNDFILYGGTALALRLGHRSSVDFDFFSFRPLDPAALRSQVPLLRSAELLQLEPNTLTVLTRSQEATVKLSFFGGLTFGQIADPDLTEDKICQVAGLPDLMATKLNTVYQRAEQRDYLDIYALLQSGLTLAQGLEYARQVYGQDFNALLPLQALCYFEEPELQPLPDSIKLSLIAAVQSMR